MDSRPETGPAPPPSAAPLPGLAGLREAVVALTPVGRRHPRQAVGTSAIYYPVVGLLLGLLWLGTDRLAARWE